MGGSSANLLRGNGARKGNNRVDHLVGSNLKRGRKAKSNGKSQTERVKTFRKGLNANCFGTSLFEKHGEKWTVEGGEEGHGTIVKLRGGRETLCTRKKKSLGFFPGKGTRLTRTVMYYRS